MFRHGLGPEGKIFYTTGRLTSEMVIKTVQMGIPILVSRSGFTAWGVELARKADLTLIGRARGKRFLALSGAERIVFDADPHHAARGGAPVRPQGRAGRGGVSEVAGAAAGGRPGAPDGRRRQVPAPARRAAAAGAGGRARTAAGRRPGAQRQRRSGAVRGVSACPWWPTACRGSRGRSPACWPAWSGRRRNRPRCAYVVSIATRHAVLSRATSSRGCWQPVERGAAELACAASGGRTHPVFGLWPVSLAGELRRALVEEGMRKIDRWTARYRLVAVEFAVASRSIRSSTRTRPRTWPWPKSCCVGGRLTMAVRAPARGSAAGLGIAAACFIALGADALLLQGPGPRADRSRSWRTGSSGRRCSWPACCRSAGWSEELRRLPSSPRPLLTLAFTAC